MKKLTISILVLMAVLSFGFTGQALAAKKVAVLPFGVNAEKDMTFLQQGIYDMLTSRLQSDGNVTITPKNTTVNAAAAVDTTSTEGRRALAKKLNVDYLVSGMLTVIGNGVSVDVKVTSPDAKDSERSFSDMTSDMGAVINRMDGISRNIKNYVTGGSAPQSGMAVNLPAVTDRADNDLFVDEPAQQSASQAPDTSRLNPEEAFKRQMGSGQAYALLSDNEEAAQALLLNFWRGPVISYPAMGICVADIDGDGYNETIVASVNKLYVYRMVNDNFHTITEIQLPGTSRIISIDTGDINRNGIPEIYLTRLEISRSGLASSVVEFNKSSGKYEVIADGLSYWLRIAKTPNRGEILLGLKHRIAMPFQRQFFEMEWSGNTLVESSRWRTGYMVNPLGTTIGEMMGEYKVVAFDDMDHWRIYSDNGRQEFESAGVRGGTTIYYEMPNRDQGSIQKEYLPMRLQMRYVKGGPAQVVVPSNEDAVGRKLANSRVLSEFLMYGYTYNGLDMDLAWKTRRTKGFARDFFVGDFDNDGQDELVILVIQSEGDSPFTSNRGLIITYELPPGN